MIEENLKKVDERIREACERAGRAYSDVTLIAVSKTKPVEMIEEAIRYGKREFGENKAQEFKEKYDLLQKDLTWHFIGHLQTNKVKYVVGRASLIHSLDSLHLAEEIELESAKKNVISNVLLEVNFANEASKFGFKPEEVLDIAGIISKFPHICIKGLMTVAPFVEDVENNRKIFRGMKNLSVDIEHKNIDNVSMAILSMGMTNDYEVAIEEGATHVRIGTGIFGERDYSI